MMFPAKTNPFWQEQLNFLHTAYTYSYMYGDQLRSIIVLKSPRGCPKSLYRSRAGADFGPVGNTEKKMFGPIMSNF